MLKNSSDTYALGLLSETLKNDNHFRATAEKPFYATQLANEHRSSALINFKIEQTKKTVKIFI